MLKSKQLKDTIKILVPPFLLDWYHFFLAFLGALIYRFPSGCRYLPSGKNKKMKVIGITGTEGKSTVVEFTAAILREAGRKTASISSIKFRIKEQEWENKLGMTMPGRMKLQKFLRAAVNSGCEYAVLEITSEGILEHRQKFIDFDTVIFTNLAAEHIERHGSFEKYRQAKEKLFAQCKKVHIINLDDKNAFEFLKFPANEKWGYRINPILPRAEQNLKIVEAKNQEILPAAVKFSVNNINFQLNLLGAFNIYNALAAICAGLSQGIKLETSKSALEKIKGVPGRMEIIINSPFRVIVDYAHTPDSLRKVYNALKSQSPGFPSPKLICVFGAAGGGRDKWKRPEMGKIAAQYCNKIILANEDPFDENPTDILSEIKSGAQAYFQKRQAQNIYEILDRREAISKALKMARPGNIVVITGKGCEPWLRVENGKKIPWDDREVVRREFFAQRLKREGGDGKI